MKISLTPFGFPVLLFLIIGFISCRQDETLDDTPDEVID